MASQHRDLRLAAALGAFALLALLAYVAAGPYLAMRGLERAIAAKDVAGVQRHVDFPALKANLKAQIEDRLARSFGAGGDGLLGRAAKTLANEASASAVDAMASPVGIAILLQGSSLARGPHGAAHPAPDAAARAPLPLSEAQTRYESPSRFTATLPGAGGQPVVFVFGRSGLRWRLTDIRLDPGSAATGAP